MFRYPKGSIVTIELPEKCNLLLRRDWRRLLSRIAIDWGNGVAIVETSSNSAEFVIQFPLQIAQHPNGSSDIADRKSWS